MTVFCYDIGLGNDGIFVRMWDVGDSKMTANLLEYEKESNSDLTAFLVPPLHRSFSKKTVKSPL